VRTLNILSIDLDWFNYWAEGGSVSETRRAVERCFYSVIDHCYLPNKLAWMQEHQYLYPWVLRLLRSRQAKQVNVVNIDEHHDFYRVGSVKDFKKHHVSCADFFGFMVFDGILNGYEWVNNGMTHSNRMGRRDVVWECERCQNPTVAAWGNQNARRLHVWDRNRLVKAIEGRIFDGVAIIESPYYTRKLGTIRKQAQKILQEEGFEVKTHQCKTDFLYSKRKKVDMRPIFRAATMA